MKRVIEVDDNNALRLHGEDLGLQPHAHYELEQDGRTLILRPIEDVKSSDNERPLWEYLTPKQRAEEFLAWVKSLPRSSVHLTDEQLRRENIYD